MTYDWLGTIVHEQTSPEFLAEVEQRFRRECWFAQSRGAPPFSGLIDFDALAGSTTRGEERRRDALDGRGYGRAPSASRATERNL